MWSKPALLIRRTEAASKLLLMYVYDKGNNIHDSKRNTLFGAYNISSLKIFTFCRHGALNLLGRYIAAK